MEYPPFGAFTKDLKYIDYDIIEQDKDGDYEPSDSEDEMDDDDDFFIPTSSHDDDNDDPASSDDEGEVAVQKDATTNQNDSRKRSGTVNYAELNSGKRSTPR